MNITEQWLTNGTVHIAYDDKFVQVTRYYSLHGNSRAWAIQCRANIADHKNLEAAISYCKKEIADHKKYIKPTHGITEYI